MTVNLNELKCSKSHEYIMTCNTEAIIGITQYAVDQLGDVTYIEMPEIGKKLKKGDVFGTVESVKAASDLYIPVDCTVLAVNTDLESNPEYVNDEPYTKGWLLKITDINTTQLTELLNYETYLRFVEGQNA